MPNFQFPQLLNPFSRLCLAVQFFPCFGGYQNQLSELNLTQNFENTENLKSAQQDYKLILKFLSHPVNLFQNLNSKNLISDENLLKTFIKFCYNKSKNIRIKAVEFINALAENYIPNFRPNSSTNLTENLKIMSNNFLILENLGGLDDFECAEVGSYKSETVSQLLLELKGHKKALKSLQALRNQVSGHVLSQSRTGPGHDQTLTTNNIHDHSEITRIKPIFEKLDRVLRDSSLHPAFIMKNGVESIIDLLVDITIYEKVFNLEKRSLTYFCCKILIKILLKNKKMRISVSNNILFMLTLTKIAKLVKTDVKTKSVVSILLFLLAFSDEKFMAHREDLVESKSQKLGHAEAVMTSVFMSKSMKNNLNFPFLRRDKISASRHEIQPLPSWIYKLKYCKINLKLSWAKSIYENLYNFKVDFWIL